MLGKSFTDKFIKALPALFLLTVLAGTSQAAVFNLRADTTTMTMPGTGEVVTMWGFALDAGPVTVPGPTLTVPPGDSTLTINLTNNLQVPVSLVIPGQIASMTPTRSVDGRVLSFTAEAAPTLTQTYTWNNFKTGTYIYQSGTNPAAQMQMGLYGAVKKDEAAGKAYASDLTLYSREAILFFSEIDPVLHNAIATGNYGPGKTITSTINYEPKYFLINGTPYSPTAQTIYAGNAGDRVLLRFLNTGYETHVPVIQGMYMSILAEDGSLLPYPREQYSLVLPSGKTFDAIITPTAAGTIPVYDRRFNLTNNASAPGGMLTYLTISEVQLIVNKSGLGKGTVTSIPAGINCGTDCAEIYSIGTLVDLTALPVAGTGSTFTGWSGGGCAGTGTCSVTINSNTTVTASFTGIYSISGTVKTSSGTPVPGVTVSLGGDAVSTQITDALGGYSFTALPAGNFSLSASMAGYNFTPASRAVTITVANVALQDFTAVTYEISGSVVTSSGTSLAGVTVTLSGASAATTATDALGSYKFIDLLAGSYTVTPSLAGYSFMPVSRNVNITTASAIGQNFTAVTYTISGSVKTPSGAGISAVTITLSGAASASVTTDIYGNYTLTNLINGAYTVTPNKAGYVFTPLNRAVTINNANVTGQNFTSVYSISGTVRTSAGSPLAGVTITLSGAGSATTTTDAAGYYIFANLVNGTYTLTPSLAGYGFSPTSRAVTMSNANITAQDFTALTYSISGTIRTSSGTMLSGVTMTLSGAANATTTTNASGYYIFANLLAGSYTVTPSLAGYNFTPLNRALNITTANYTGQDFTAVTYIISGSVRTPSGVGISAVTITLSGAASKTVTTDIYGNYTLTNLINGDYTVTPSKAGYVFTPLNRAVTINSANVTGQNFTQLVLYSISGYVRTSIGTMLSGVTMTLGGAANATTTTNASGYYTFANLLAGSYTVTPSLAGYSFTPVSRNVSITTANVGGQDFTAPTYTISGSVKTPSGVGISAVTITLSGAASKTVTTDIYGNYTLTNLINGDYTVTPGKTGYVFTPLNRAVTINNANVTGQNFTQLVLYSISGYVSTSSATALAGVTMTLSGAANATTTTNASGYYTFANLLAGSYTVTPSLAGYSFTPVSRNVSITIASAIGQNFTALTYTISGSVRTPSGVGISAVTITLSGAASKTVTTDIYGNYTLTNLINGAYTVTPSKAGYTFTPVSRNVTISGANATGQNFSSP